MRIIAVTFYSDDIGDFGMPKHFHQYCIFSGPDRRDPSIQRTRILTLSEGSPEPIENDLQSKTMSEEEQIVKSIMLLKRLDNHEDLKFTKFDIPG